MVSSPSRLVSKATQLSKSGLCFYPNNRILWKKPLFTTEATSTLPRTSSFLSSHIHLSILISATFIFWTYNFLTDQQSIPYSRVGLRTTLSNLPLSLSDTFLSHRTLDVSLHFNYLVPIWYATSLLISPSPWIIEPRYLKLSWGWLVYQFSLPHLPHVMWHWTCTLCTLL